MAIPGDARALGFALYGIDIAVEGRQERCTEHRQVSNHLKEREHEYEKRTAIAICYGGSPAH